MRTGTILRSPWRWGAGLILGVFALTGMLISLNADSDVPSIVIGLVIMAVSLAMAVSWLWWQGVALRRDVLRVRRAWTSREYSRADVAAVEVEKAHHEVAQYPVAHLVLVLSDGKRVSLDVLQQLGFGKRARRRVERYVRTIEEWQQSVETSESPD